MCLPRPALATLGLSHPLWASVSSPVNNTVWQGHASQPFPCLHTPGKSWASSPAPTGPGLLGCTWCGLGGALGTGALQVIPTSPRDSPCVAWTPSAPAWCSWVACLLSSSPRRPRASRGRKPPRVLCSRPAGDRALSAHVEPECLPRQGQRFIPGAIRHRGSLGGLSGGDRGQQLRTLRLPAVPRLLLACSASLL